MKRLIYQATTIALLTTSLNTIGILSPAISIEVSPEGSKVESTILAIKWPWSRSKSSKSCVRKGGGKCQARSKRDRNQKRNQKSKIDKAKLYAKRLKTSSVNNQILSSEN